MGWNCIIKLHNDKHKKINYIGIRSHQIAFAKNETSNNYCCWPVYTTEAPFKQLVYLRLNNILTESNGFHLVWEISSEQWELIKHRPLPWKIHQFDENLIFM